MLILFQRGTPYERKPSTPKKKSPLKFSVEFMLKTSPKSNKNRFNFTKEQANILKEYFHLYPLPNCMIKQEICDKTGLSTKQITVRLTFLNLQILTPPLFFRHGSIIDDHVFDAESQITMFLIHESLALSHLVLYICFSFSR